MSCVLHGHVFHLRRLRAVRRQLGRDVSARLVTALLVLSRLDYCNAVLAGLPATTLVPLQRVLTAQLPDYNTDLLIPHAINIPTRWSLRASRNGISFYCVQNGKSATTHSLSLHFVYVIDDRQS